MRKRVFFIYTERYSDFNSMIERYEKEMRKLFEESRKANSSFEEPAKETAVFPEDSPQIPQFQEREQGYIDVPEQEILPLQEEEPLPPKKDKTGSMVVEVTTARGAVPLEGVTVVIDRFDVNDPMGRKELMAILETNSSGRTKAVELPAADKELSLEPGQKDPFYTYYVSVKNKGFDPVKERPVDVFSGEISILKIGLIPTPENLFTGGAADG